MSSFTIIAAIEVGVLATIAMDVVAAAGIGLRVFRLPAFGRWFLCFFRGTIRHANIEKSPAIRGEQGLTFPLHYLAGIALAALYLLLLDGLSLGRGSLLLAAAYGTLTSLIPFLVMLPSMGYGWFGLGPSRLDVFWLRQILAMHLSYGVGIGLAVPLFVPG